MSEKRKALGRGLSALINDKPKTAPPPAVAAAPAAAPAPAAPPPGPLILALDRIQPNPTQPRQRFGAIAVLCAMLVGADHDLAVERQPAPGKLLQPCAHILRQHRVAVDVEAQLHRGGHLVDILSARPGRADEAFLKVALVQREGGGDRNHRRQCNALRFPNVHFAAKRETTGRSLG